MMERIFHNMARCFLGNLRVKTLLVLIACIWGLAGFMLPAFGAESKRVLVLNSYHNGYPWTDNLVKGIDAVMRTAEIPVSLYIEYMDTKRISDEKHYENIFELYKHKLFRRKFDLIISSDDNAFRFLLKYRSELFPGIPIIFCGLNKFEDSLLVGQDDITGVVEGIDFKGTIELALQLQPDVKNVVVVTDGTKTGVNQARGMRKIIPQMEDRVNFSFFLMTDLTMQELLDKLNGLGNDSIMIPLGQYRDKAGNVFSLKESMALITKKCNVPIYVLTDVKLGYGTLGGKVVSGFAQGEMAAQMALRVLKGESPSNIPVVKQSPNRYMFDHEQVIRHGIKFSDLPTGSIVLNIPFSFYEEYKPLIWSAIAVIVVLLLLIFFLFWNIMYRKRAEDALRKSEERYRALFEDNPIETIVVDKDARITMYNKAKRTSGERLPRIRDVMYKDYAADHLINMHQELMECIKLGKSKDFRNQNYNNRFLDIRMSPLEEGAIITMIDLTEKKKLEDQLQRAQKMEAMGLMAGGVAHDLNNILSGIVSYPELLLMDIPEDSPMWKPIKTIQESGMRAADVVEDLLTIARGVATSKEALNLNTLITEYLGSAEYEKLEKTHSFVSWRTEMDPDLLNMSGSPTHIKKILMNLVANGTEAIEGSGTVTISTTNQYLDEPLKGYEDVRIGEYTVLKISDDGSGISPEDLERIFEPFYTKKMMGRSGTGLGLAVVWNSIQDHNGYINVRSSEKGTVFELYFPTTREQVADEGEQVPLDDYLGHGEKILVVDDEERQREIASGILNRLGYTAEAVSSGEEAIEYVKENPVDLIVLDMVMPKGINGRKTYEEIIKIRPGQKAIIASGYAKTKEVDKAQELGAGKYIKKPYTLPKVGLAVKEELEK